MPDAASAARAASRVVFSGLTRRSSGAGASHARARSRALVLAVRGAETRPQPVRQVGGDRGLERRREPRLECREPARIGLGHERCELAHAVPELAHDHGQREPRRRRPVCASASSERRRRRNANTPSAMSARSCCPIAGCRRKKWWSRVSAGTASGRTSAIAAARPASWFARSVIAARAARRRGSSRAAPRTCRAARCGGS